MAKKVTAYIKLQVGAGSANPAPPVGPALGQHGVNIMEFCKAFNAHTAKLEKGAPVPVVITVYQDKSFTFISKTPPASYLIKKALNIQTASHKPGKESAGHKLVRYGRFPSVLPELIPNSSSRYTNPLVPAVLRCGFSTVRIRALESASDALPAAPRAARIGARHAPLEYTW